MPKTWIIKFVPEAEEDIDRLSSVVRRRIIKKLDWLEKHFDSITPLPLGGRWRGFFKLRVGHWRIIFKIEWKKNRIIVIVVDHRTKIYKRGVK